MGRTTYADTDPWDRAKAQEDSEMRDPPSTSYSEGKEDEGFSGGIPVTSREQARTTPESNLIQRLRTCSVEERRAVAMELARSRTDEAVAELIKRINDGKYCPAKYGKRHWFSLSESLLQEEVCEGDYESQLVAIEALGETRREEALKYLIWLYKERKTEGRYRGGTMQGSGDLPSGGYDRCFSYPNANGPLAKALKWEEDCSDYFQEGPDNKRPHEVIKKSIQKLEATVKNAPTTQEV
jgi:hypothetical protein